MPRGGSRQGTPGKGYSNRTDLQSKPDMEKNTAATGGMEPPPQPSGASPEDTPMLTDPTNRPGEPITQGLANGPGAGPEALSGFDPRQQETQIVAAKWGGIISHIANQPDAPDSVRILSNYLRGF